MRSEAWNHERVALLKLLWAKGETAQAIGVRLGGVSRSAVLGKIFRLRLDVAKADRLQKPQNNAANDRGGETGRQVTGPEAGMANPAPSSTKDSPARRRRNARRKISSPPRRMVPTGRGKSLLQLTNDSCRFPYVPPPQMAV